MKNIIQIKKEINSIAVGLFETVSLVDIGSKWTLTIKGEKKFDYNVVKPNELTALLKYEKSLKSFVANL